MKFLSCFLVLGFLVSCDEEDESYGFTTSEGMANEGDGIISVSINLGRRVTSGTTINYMVAGSAFLNGDYELNTPASLTSSTFTVQAKTGESTVTIPIQLIDDSHVEQENESIFIAITGSSDIDLNKSLTKNQYTLEIADNDMAPQDGLQIDLSWYVGDGISINTLNFDLYLAHNLQFDSAGLLTTFELVDSYESTNSKGFESFIIRQDIPDGPYYAIIKFVEGTMAADVFLHMSHGDQYGTASGRVNTNYVGRHVYYGPINKTGNEFYFEQ